MPNVVILGSTGSIGTSTLKVLEHIGGSYRVVGLAARGGNSDLIVEQVRKWGPRMVSVADESAASLLAERLKGSGVEVRAGDQGIIEAASLPDAEIVVAAISGSAGLAPTMSAVKLGRKVLLANKEVLVMAGSLFKMQAALSGAEIVPVDSEHSAIFQCLRSGDIQMVEKLILTASGGPFLRMEVEDLEGVTPEMALNHPRWSMGKKVTVDSATMMNKGLEVIEAYWLFELPPEKIDVLIHPQSIVHSMVQFVDGSLVAQLSVPDMKIPIQYAFTHPLREVSPCERVNFAELGCLEFENPDSRRFPALELARNALREGESMPVVLNAANEVAVCAFLENRIGFLQITRAVGHAMKKHTAKPLNSLEEVMAHDAWSREVTEKWICS